MPLIKSKEYCIDCGQLLTADDEIPEGIAEKSIWDGVYETFFMFRRERWVCMNPKCRSYYPKTHHKFLKGLTGKIHDEHFLDDSVRTTRAKPKKK